MMQQPLSFHSSTKRGIQHAKKQKRICKDQSYHFACVLIVVLAVVGVTFLKNRQNTVILTSSTLEKVVAVRLAKLMSSKK